MSINIVPRDPAVDVDAEIQLRLHGDIDGAKPGKATWSVTDDYKNPVGELRDAEAHETDNDQERSTIDAEQVVWRAARVRPGRYTIRAIPKVGRAITPEVRAEITVHAHAVRVAEPVQVDLHRADIPDTPDEALWQLIKLGTEALSYDHYAAWMEYLFCHGDLPPSPYPGYDRRAAHIRDEFAERAHRSSLDSVGAPLPFADMEGYKVLVAATQAFLELNCEVAFDHPADVLGNEIRGRIGLESDGTLRSLWRKYLKYLDGTGFIPYLYLVRQKLGDVALTDDRLEGELCNKILRKKFTSPCLIELIWSYWHEEGMLVQTINAISMRFQNRRKAAGADPLANLAIDPLRPLSNLLWGYIQDEQHRLTVPRRAYEYDGEYGMTLLGQAVPSVRAAESRPGFLPAFHDLLHRASIFYKEDDDTTIIADAFPVLNALGEVHLLLAEGANNQYRDLPWTARCEMLIQQWLLARPEFREFLPTRVMVAYPEPWMDRVDAMKKIQGWTGTSVRFFHDLGRYGEQILLSIRYGDWSNVTNREQAANWCRTWRQEMQWYIHAYQSVTGVDLSADMADVRQAEQAQARALPPAFHLQRRLAEQHRGNGAALRRQAAPLPGQPV